MDSLPHSVLLEILSRLDNSADVARRRIASKGFNVVFPGLRSINLRCSWKWYSRASTSERVKLFRTVFLDLISKLDSVESICTSFYGDFSQKFIHADEDFAVEWLPRVSASLKSLSIHRLLVMVPMNVLALLSEYCHSPVNLELSSGLLSGKNLNTMPMLTSLTLESLYMVDKHLNELNKCFPNLQFLKLVNVVVLIHPKIHLLNLKTLHWVECMSQPSLTIITPNLVTLKIELSSPRAILHVEAPLLSQFHIYIGGHDYALETKKFEMKTLWLEALNICCLLSRFPITKTVETLTLDLVKEPQIPECRGSEFTLGKVFTVFPNVSSLSIRSRAWLKLEACSDPEVVSKILGGREGLKTICAYLKLADPKLTFSVVACVSDQCVGLSDVSLLIHSDVTGPVIESFRSKCMARWPGLKWRWGRWSKHKEDYWITDSSSIEHHKSSKKQRL